MLDVTVKRSEWGRGSSVIGSRLYNPETKKRCCLGFAGNAAGITDEQMANILTPSHLQLRRDFVITDELLHHGGNSPICFNLMSINDSRIYDDENLREADLIEKGKLAGINFTFVD